MKTTNPIVAARIEACLNDVPAPPPPAKPHVAERIEKRMDIEVGHAELGDLLRLVQDGGPNISVTRQSMELLQEIKVLWRGKEFHVIYNRTAGRLVTAYAKSGKRFKPKRVPGLRPKDWRMAAAYDDAE